MRGGASKEVLDTAMCTVARLALERNEWRRRAEAAEATLERVRALHEFDGGYCKSCEIPFHECGVAMELAALAPVTEEGDKE